MQVSCKYVLQILTIVAAIAFSVSPAQAQTLVIVRHAEKLEPWPAEDRLQPLSVEGLRRAEQLRNLVANLDIKAVFTSSTTRALSTAMPAALSKGLVPNVHPASEKTDSLDAFMSMVRNTYGSSDFVLVVSHSNIIPEWLTRFRIDASTLTEMGISFNSRYNGYLVDGYDGVWLVSLPIDAQSAPHVRYATMNVD
jgi:broad specificity phosphatase PhoE